jgi:dTDP-4-amino-4,6-dideoxygalactose transaminase
LKVPFFRPDITILEINAVTQVLESGWLTTGPKGFELAQKIAEYSNTTYGYIVDSATAGLFLALKYYGVTKGDEVITTPYTYAATINVIVQCGATPVLVDILEDDFSIDKEKIRSHITSKTKAIMSVDFAGFPVDYDGITEVINEKKALFKPSNSIQEQVGQILFISDAAHSFGSFYKGKKVGPQADITVFSFQAVKNLTMGEGGGVVFDDKPHFNGQQFYDWLKLMTLHGQNKMAYEKNLGQWHYDILMPGLKYNAPDILSVIALSQLSRYEDMLSLRRKIMNTYLKELDYYKNLIMPLFETKERQGNGHFFALRVKDENARNNIINQLAQKGVAANVHFIPIPMHSYYQSFFSISDFPIAYKNYQKEISLPVFSSMKKEELAHIVSSLHEIFKEVG